jgi:hypothetical protein
MLLRDKMIIKVTEKNIKIIDDEGNAYQRKRKK